MFWLLWAIWYEVIFNIVPYVVGPELIVMKRMWAWWWWWKHADCVLCNIKETTWIVGFYRCGTNVVVQWTTWVPIECWLGECKANVGDKCTKSPKISHLRVYINSSLDCTSLTLWYRVHNNCCDGEGCGSRGLDNGAGDNVLSLLRTSGHRSCEWYRPHVVVSWDKECCFGSKMLYKCRRMLQQSMCWSGHWHGSIFFIALCKCGSISGSGAIQGYTYCPDVRVQGSLSMVGAVMDGRAMTAQSRRGVMRWGPNITTICCKCYEFQHLWGYLRRIIIVSWL